MSVSGDPCPCQMSCMYVLLSYGIIQVIQDNSGMFYCLMWVIIVHVRYVLFSYVVILVQVLKGNSCPCQLCFIVLQGDSCQI